MNPALHLADFRYVMLKFVCTLWLFVKSLIISNFRVRVSLGLRTNIYVHSLARAYFIYRYSLDGATFAGPCVKVI